MSDLEQKHLNAKYLLAALECDDEQGAVTRAIRLADYLARSQRERKPSKPRTRPCVFIFNARTVQRIVQPRPDWGVSVSQVLAYATIPG